MKYLNKQYGNILTHLINPLSFRIYILLIHAQSRFSLMLHHIYTPIYF